MSRLIRTLADLRPILTGVIALILVSAACALAFTGGRETLIALFVSTACGLLADPRAHGRTTDSASH